MDRVVLATSDLDRDTELADHAAHCGFPVFRGSESDLVERYLAAAEIHATGPYIVRATGDNVFMDWDEVDRQIDIGIADSWDFLGYDNMVHPDRVNDFAAEFIRVEALRRVAALTNDPEDREHVNPYFYAHPETFRVNLIQVAAYLHTPVKLDLDTPEDLALLQRIGVAVDDPITVPAAEVVRRVNELVS